MKLTSEDKKILLKFGYPKEDFYQIERATTKTTYEIYERNNNNKIETNYKKISQSEALDILGREIYLSGISRSAFHNSACRDNENGQTVYFDSSRLFK